MGYYKVSVCSRKKYFNDVSGFIQGYTQSFLQLISLCLNIFEVANVQTINLKITEEHYNNFSIVNSNNP